MKIPPHHRDIWALCTHLNFDNCCWITSPCSKISFMRRSILLFCDLGWIVWPCVIHTMVDLDLRCRRRRTIALLMLPVGLSRPLSRSPARVWLKLWCVVDDDEWCESERRFSENLTCYYVWWEKMELLMRLIIRHLLHKSLNYLRRWYATVKRRHAGTFRLFCNKHDLRGIRGAAHCRIYLLISLFAISTHSISIAFNSNIFSIISLFPRRFLLNCNFWLHHLIRRQSVSICWRMCQTHSVVRLATLCHVKVSLNIL